MDDSLKNTYDENFEAYMDRVGEDICFEPMNWDWPTKAKPGSTEKIMRMKYRFENAMPLFIPGDEVEVANDIEQKAATVFCASLARRKRVKGGKKRRS